MGESSRGDKQKFTLTVKVSVTLGGWEPDLCQSYSKKKYEKLNNIFSKCVYPFSANNSSNDFKFNKLVRSLLIKALIYYLFVLV